MFMLTFSIPVERGSLPPSTLHDHDPIRIDFVEPCTNRGRGTAMSVTLRPYRSGGWEVDITIRLPDGSPYRERKRGSCFSKSAAHRWAQDRERYLLQHGGDAGLRLGEIVALEWCDVDPPARRLDVQRSDWLGHVGVPKGGRSRQLPMTQRLTAALKAARHLRTERVLCLPDGSPITRDRVIKAVRRAQRIAGIQQGVHILRHPLCSHLAMKGRLRAPSRSWPDTPGFRRCSATCR